MLIYPMMALKYRNRLCYLVGGMVSGTTFKGNIVIVNKILNAHIPLDLPFPFIRI